MMMKNLISIKQKNGNHQQIVDYLIDSMINKIDIV